MTSKNSKILTVIFHLLGILVFFKPKLYADLYNIQQVHICYKPIVVNTEAIMTKLCVWNTVAVDLFSYS